MNVARTMCRHTPKNIYKKFRVEIASYKSSQASQPLVQEEKYDFEDIKVLERSEKRLPKIPPFMKNVFCSIYNRELLAYPEVLTKEDSDALDDRISVLDKVFSNENSSREQKMDILRRTGMFAAPLNLTDRGLAINQTEALRYLETIASDVELSTQISEHWVSLRTLMLGLSREDFLKISDDLITGEHPISLCVKERISQRLNQPDFRTMATIDGQGVWRITGDKICHKDIDGYKLVLCNMEANTMKMFLVHPQAEGVSYKNMNVQFKETPGIPLDHISEQNLGKTLGLSRLYAATLTRCCLERAMDACGAFVRPRVLAGKPLSTLTTIGEIFGQTIMDVYASESAEYFTAGLLDKYENPEAELEMAMCRNYISTRGMSSMLKILAVPSVEEHTNWIHYFDDMRLLSLHGETFDAVNTFIALAGIQHAGQTLAPSVKKVRNPLMNPGYIFKKIFMDRHQEKDEPKLTLHLEEHLHPSLREASECLEYSVMRMVYACETIMIRHGLNVVTAHTELNRLAKAATEILMMTSVLARASRSYCIGVRNAELEMKIASVFVEQSRIRVRKYIKDLDDGEYVNLDHFKVNFAKKKLEESVLAPITEKPTCRVFW